MDIPNLIRLQLELECIRLNQRGYLQSFLCENPDELARLYVFHDGTTYHRYIRHDVPAEMRQLLKLMSGAILFQEHDRVQNILLEDAPVAGMFLGKTHIFPDDVEIEPDTEIVYEEQGNLCGITVDGVIVSACSSVREDDHCAEAWVHTEPDHRRKGYAKRVVQAWGHRIRQSGKIPFYSHAIENIASKHVANAAGMHWVFDIVSYT